VRYLSFFGTTRRGGVPLDTGYVVWLSESEEAAPCQLTIMTDHG
jgi:hypothetical protein